MTYIFLILSKMSLPKKSLYLSYNGDHKFFNLLISSSGHVITSAIPNSFCLDSLVLISSASATDCALSFLAAKNPAFVKDVKKL